MTIAEIIVRLIIIQTPTFVERGICNFQNTLIGTMAKTISVTVVYALTQYVKPSNTLELQHVPVALGSQSIFVGLHWRKTRNTDIIAIATWKVTMA